jgi:hypothetical protein
MITTFQANQVILYYPESTYEILQPNPERKGYVLLNSGKVPLIVFFGLELQSIWPPYPIAYEQIIYPEQQYRDDWIEIIPLAAKWLQSVGSFGDGQISYTEFF